MPNIMLEFFNTFVIKGTNIYFGYQDNVFVISKQLIVNVFGIYAKGYIKNPKGQVNKVMAMQTLQNYKIALTNFARDQWNAKSLGFPYLLDAL